MNKYKTKFTLIELLIVVTIVGLLASMIIGPVKNLVAPFISGETRTLTIVKMERVAHGQDSKYLIYTDGEVFENVDCLVKGKFDSSDLYGKLQEGQTYKAEVYGWRVKPFLNWYRNILSVTPVEN